MKHNLFLIIKYYKEPHSFLSSYTIMNHILFLYIYFTPTGTLKERGLLEQIRELDNAQENTIPKKGGFFEEGRKVYHLPLIPNRLRRSTFSKVVPIFDHVKK